MSIPKNILFLSSWFPNAVENLNGNFVQKHAKAISLLHNVYVIHCVLSTTKRSPEFYSDGQYQEKIIYLEKSGFKFIDWLRKWQVFSQETRNLPRIDLVHANVLAPTINSWFAVYYARWKKINLIFTEHWTVFQVQNSTSKVSLIQKWNARFLAKRSACICPVSNDLKNSLVHHGIISDFMVIPNVVNTQIFSPSKSKITVSTFIHLSTLVKRKRIPILLDAAVKIKEKGYNFHFKIGGDGDLIKLHQQIKERDLEMVTTILPALSEAEVASEMKRSSAFVLFSENETQGVVIPEALACGITVISTSVGGIAEILPKQFGVFVSNFEELVDAMEQHIIQLNSSDKAKNEAQSMYEYVKHTFSPSAIAQQYDSVYSKFKS